MNDEQPTMRDWLEAFACGLGAMAVMVLGAIICALVA